MIFFLRQNLAKPSSVDSKFLRDRPSHAELGEKLDSETRLKFRAHAESSVLFPPHSAKRQRYGVKKEKVVPRVDLRPPAKQDAASS